MNVFITGITGMLGMDVETEALRRGYNVFGCGRTDMPNVHNYIQLDLTTDCHWQLIEIFRNNNINCVIHCAAYTNVDKAESDRETALKANMNATAEVVEAAEKCGIPIIYISSDYVYNSQDEKPIKEEDIYLAPNTYYGYTKYLGEQIVTNTTSKYYIVRTSWLFGYNGKNFVDTMLQLGRTKNELQVVNDQVGRPTYTEDLAAMLLDMAESDNYGTYNVTNSGPYISWYEFAKTIFKISNIDTPIAPVSSSFYAAPAKRPKNSRLNCDKVHKAGFRQMPNWEESLKNYLMKV